MSTPTENLTDFTDVAAFVETPRVTALAVSPDGARLVAAIARPDAAGSRYVSALWELDPDGVAPPRRLTFAEKGESAPVFTPDGALLFVSARPGPDSQETAAIWELPAFGEAFVRAATPGPLALADVGAGGVLATGSVLAGGTLAGDEGRRRARKDSKVTGIWHTGMPIRYWDKELDDVSPRLFVLDGDGPVDLTPDADTLALLNASAALSPDGRWAVTTWTTREPRGETATTLVALDVDAARRGAPAAPVPLVGGGFEHHAPSISPDGRRIAWVRSTRSSHADTSYSRLLIAAFDGDRPLADPLVVDLGHQAIGEHVWAPDGRSLFVAGDRHSRGAIARVDAVTGAVSLLADDAAYSGLTVAEAGLYALRSTVAEPPAPVRVDRQTGERAVVPAPGRVAGLPGSLAWVSTAVDGVEVGGWLCLPDGAGPDAPAPLQVWIHGGPHGSYNAWSWRWCPWLAVARGYAVLMPDPAMSTGYGDAGLNRAWPRRPDLVWAEVEALADHVLATAPLDADRTALLGASFGGFMTNWVAGRTDRFRAVVTHAGLWALDQQHPTTDAAAHKIRVHGTPAQRPEWFAQYSPHERAAQVRTPMLVIHGNRDYRVPVSEALRLWWDLVAGWDGAPEDLPHRFLQFTSENHWVLGPANAWVWNTAVAQFVDHHVLGTPLPDRLPEPAVE